MNIRKEIENMSSRNKFRYQPPMTSQAWSDTMLRDVLDDYPYPDYQENSTPSVKVLSDDEARAMARKALLDSDAAYYSRRQ